MPDYVYALHDFLPENEDEVSFRAGDRIEVVEKDDMYGDGWWQVCIFSFRPGRYVPRTGDNWIGFSLSTDNTLIFS